MTQKNTDTEKSTQNQIDRILANQLGICQHTGETAPKLLDTQLDTLRTYTEYYEALPSPRGGKVKVASVLNVLIPLRHLGLFLKENGIKEYKDATKNDIIAYAKKINAEYEDTTRSRHKLQIRAFYRWLYDIKEKQKYPEVVDDPRLVPETIKNKKRPQDLPTQEEIRAMLNVAGNDRNRSIIMLTVGEGGLRAGEIQSLNIGGIEFDERGCKVWIEKSKSKERYVRLTKGEPYLRNYVNKEYILNKHTKTNSLFYSLSGRGAGGRLNKNSFNILLKRIAKRAGITKRIYTHIGRAVNISILSKRGMSAEFSGKRFGISPRTVQNTYLTIDDTDVDEVYLRMEGKLEDKERFERESKILEPKLCPRCNTTLPVNVLYCNCGMCVDEVEAMRLQEREQKTQQKAHEFLAPEAVQRLFKTMYKIQKRLEAIEKG